MREKLLLDTDIGSDIDDAVCLAYLLANPACDLLGITTVSGEARQRASMASALCRVAGKNIPIYPGREHPLLNRLRQAHAQQASVLPRWPHDTDFADGEAIEFMRSTIHAHPGEVTLLAIGPLTNVAALFAADESVPGLLKSLVIMGGNFLKPIPMEWNILLDPAAAAIVYHQPVKHHRSIGLDVTRQVVLSAEETRERFQAPLLKPVLEFAEVWFKEQKVITFHDPLAATTIFDADVCQFKQGQITIELANPHEAGRTDWVADPKGPHDVALEVDSERFFKHFFSFFE